VLLKNLLQGKNIGMNFYEFPKMIHDFPLIAFLPEAKAAIGIIANLITSNPTSTN
jgi:acetyl esterase/lipase